MSRFMFGLVLSACLFATGLVGCGSEVGTSLNTAYSICYDAGATTEEIDLWVRTFRIARNDGVPGSVALGAFIPACGADLGCQECLTALVDAMF